MRTSPLPWLAPLLLAFGCSSDTTTPADAAADATSDAAADVVAPDTEADAEADTASPPPNPDCDPLDPSVCALPWPSNLYLSPDDSRPTGYAIDFGPTSLPKNHFYEVPIDPTPYRRRDGYGLHSPLLVSFPNVDLDGLATEYDPSASLDADAPIVWLAVTGDGVERVPYFVDVDVRDADPATRLLIVRPAVLLEEATRYVVAFRGLVDTAGQPFAPSPAFAALRDGQTAGDPLLAPRQARFDDLFGVLEGAGVARAELTLAWDFVTASSESLHGWMLDVRDQALAATGEDGPELTITEVTTYTPEDNEHIAVELVGTFRVPHFMRAVTPEGGPQGWNMNVDAEGRPTQDGWADAPLWIRIPRNALDGPAHDLMLYGHGQNGRGSQVRSGFNSKIAHDHGFIFFATDMWGMSEEDVPGIISMLGDLSAFPALSDRLIQGVVNHALLARAMMRRFPNLDEVADLDLTVNTDEVYYSGISQGGIYGATIVAVSPDIRRGHLGVPGNHYGFLLLRSRNFESFFGLLSLAYTDRPSQLLALHAIQLLWDDADPSSYLRRIHDPLPGSPENAILLVPAKGDPQVAVSSNEWVARSDIGVALMANYDAERTVWGVDETPYPHTGSGVVLYDFGNPWPPGSVNAPPTDEMADPHELPRRRDWHNVQLEHFLRTGEIIDVCGGDGCRPD